MVSTAIGLAQAKRNQLQPAVWWISKLSALAVATSAFALASVAGDRIAQFVFGILFMFALVATGFLARRRFSRNFHRQTKL